uniref:U3 small nucleolar RNA-associated protein 20 C-terminal domain-containing protein n=1 Tax=Anguilla anguilla TaxID=7936 RepID=A0A0E9Q015_ANGAN
MFAAHKPEERVAQWRSLQGDITANVPVATKYLVTDLDKKMRELVLSFCSQLQSKFLDTSLGEQVIKNLLFVAKVIYLISPESESTETLEAG